MSAFLPAPLTMLVFSLSIITFFLARPSMARVTFSSLMPRSSEIAWPPLGGSPPELGGLRKTPSDPLTPSVQIQADAVEQLLAGRVPRTLASAPIVQPLTVLVIGMLAVVLGAALSPASGTAILTAAVALLWIAAIAVSALADRLRGA